MYRGKPSVNGIHWKLLDKHMAICTPLTSMPLCAGRKMSTVSLINQYTLPYNLRPPLWFRLPLPYLRLDYRNPSSSPIQGNTYRTSDPATVILVPESVDCYRNPFSSLNQGNIYRTSDSSSVCSAFDSVPSRDSHRCCVLTEIMLIYYCNESAVRGTISNPLSAQPITYCWNKKSKWLKVQKSEGAECSLQLYLLLTAPWLGTTSALVRLSYYNLMKHESKCLKIYHIFKMFRA